MYICCVTSTGPNTKILKKIGKLLTVHRKKIKYRIISGKYFSIYKNEKCDSSAVLRIVTLQGKEEFIPYYFDY